MRSTCLNITGMGLWLILALSACGAVDPPNGLAPADQAAAGGGEKGEPALMPYMDDQEAELRECLYNSSISVWRAGDRIILNMPARLLFDTGSATIKPGLDDSLKSVALVLKLYERTTVELIGHTDNVGPESYNQTLSKNRAQAVAQYLARQGIGPSRLMIAGMGEKQPIASNDTPEGRSRNRRVELRITPLRN